MTMWNLSEKIIDTLRKSGRISEADIQKALEIYNRY